MISYGIHAPPKEGGQAIGRLIWIILAIVLPVHVVAPVLTGTITWVPHNRVIEHPSDSVISAHAVTSEGEWWGWRGYSPRWQRTCVLAAGLANFAWERNSPNSIMKRTLPSAARLEINSTISNMALSYFSIRKLEWVEDPQRTLTPRQLDFQDTCANITLYDGDECALAKELGNAALLSDGPAVWNNKPFPPSSIVSETRLVRLYMHWRGRDKIPCPSLSNAHPNVSLYDDGNICWAFAWVTYTAGVGVCTRCRVSSYGVVQNDEELSVMADHMTSEALFMMPTVISMMVLMNTTIPSLRGDVDEYVTALLGCSYGASWTALTTYIGW